MRLLAFSLVALSWVNHVLSRAVFAHFMVGNTEHYSAADWIDDIKLAQEAHIDAFALNMAKGEPMNAKAIADAFSNAEALGFKLFFSFDYAGRGPFSKEEVITWINKYASSSAYFRYQGKPFVSTFEGPDQAEDWVDIKATTGCFFIPDWSSLGADPAVAKAGGVADGLFSWAGWPWGDHDMETYVDASYRRALKGKPYMMPVSPWFYTNLPGFGKNWLWRGDHLWFDRWIQVNVLMPEFVQIISWNDYGESHHIGPIRDHALVAFDTGKAPYMYSLDHHGWRVFLPFAIDRYKNSKATITYEGVSFWYRPTPKGACSTGGTTGNTVSQVQMEFQSYDIIEDSVFFTILSTEAVTITVTIGGVASKGVLRDLPDGGAGLYHGSAPFDGRTGDVRISVWRKDVLIADETGPAIKNDCHNGMTGFDAWAGGSLSSKASRPINTPSLEDEVCIRGVGANDFDVLCRTTCFWGYCPESACVCKATGAQIKLPPQTAGEVFPAEGLNSNYIGLCNYACLYGACPATYCGKTEYPLIEPTVSPFNPPACTSGTGDGEWAAICNFACYNGFCPIHRCKCTSQGPLNFLNPTQTTKAISRIGNDHGLCAFACARGYCPKSVCDASGGDQQGQTDPPVDQVEMPHLDSDCYMFPDCVDLDNTQASSCRDGYKSMSFDRGTCSGNSGRPICCKNSALPMQCTWRGSGGDCNGQCHKGEVTLFESSTGGEPGESGDSKCSRGHKVFCCELKTFKVMTSQCRWTECSEKCTADEQQVAQAEDLEGKCGLGWRKKSLCCTPEEAVFGNGVCPVSQCTLQEGICAPDEFGSLDISDEEDCDDHDELRRDVQGFSPFSSLNPLIMDEKSLFEKRGEKKKFELALYDLTQVLIAMIIYAREYPGSGKLHEDKPRNPLPSDNVFQQVPGCGSVDIMVYDRKTLTPTQISARLDTEHNPDAQWIRDFLLMVANGIRPDGLTSVSGRIDARILIRLWNAKFPKGTFPASGASRCIRTPNDYVMDQFGSKGNREPLLLCERKLNNAKGAIFNGANPTSNQNMRDIRDEALAGDTASEEELFNNIAIAIAVWNYMHHPLALPVVQKNRRNIKAAIVRIASTVPQLANLVLILIEFDSLWYSRAAQRTTEWVTAMLDAIDADLNDLTLAGLAPPNEASIRARVARLRGRISDIRTLPAP
ncbi:mutanase [Colletotrichum nymphaeae SA-01]|uniref:Mutanase n=1 Tax=Colletotrichum nymphaeae SA-01 TaxID=1460502 RepID=A0A135RWK8_9PEZI|nr:mutanase [Colletotrichum nymphaeae SA-01]